MTFRALLRSVLALCLLAPTTAIAESSEVQITAADGFELAGTLWQNDPEQPGLILLHQCNADRSMYRELAEQLADAGFRVLAFDFRGLGESVGDGFDLGEKGSEEDWDRAAEKRPEDVEAAYQFLGSQGEGPIVGTLGASCGGVEAIALATAHEEIELVGLLSARLDAYGERDALRLSDRSKLIVYAKGDAGARRPASTINYRARSSTTAIILEGEAHGYPLFEENPDLVERIVDWFAKGLVEVE